MKLNFEPKRITILPVVLLGLSIIGTGVFADNIKRSCQAEYYAWVKSINSDGRTLNVPAQAIGFAFRDHNFSAKGGCGKLVPNRCRNRARDTLLACAKAQVNAPQQKPQECRGNAITRYPIQDLTPIIKEKACGELVSKDGIRVSTLLKKPYQVTVMVGVYVSGDNGCGFSKHRTAVVEGQKYTIQGNSIFSREPLKSFTFTCQ